MAYTGKKPGDVSLSTLYESGGALQNHDDVTVTAAGDVGVGTASPAQISSSVKTVSIDGTNASISGGVSYKVNGAVKAYHYVQNDLLMHQGIAGVGHRFLANNTETVRFPSTGGITFNGDTAAANALDDYEEGTWDATLTASAGGTITLAPTASAVCYSKIGNRVFVSGRVNISAVSSPSGTIRIQLPYVVADTADNSNQGAAMVATHGINLDAGIVQLYGEFSESNSYINLFQVRDGASWTPVPASNLVANGGEWISFSGSYVTT